MVLFNYATRELTAKIVYYGPGLCGKTTNLENVHRSLPDKSRGKMLSLATQTDRTLFFDFLPVDLGQVKGMKTRIQLYTVPGQVFYDATRKLVLKGADGVVFVVDSQKELLESNLESWDNLKQNLAENNLDINKIPVVIQYNKLDLPNILPVKELNHRINLTKAPYFEAIAVQGVGVQETFKGIAKLVLQALSRRYGSEESEVAQETRTAVQTEPKQRQTSEHRQFAYAGGGGPNSSSPMSLTIDRVLPPIAQGLNTVEDEPLALEPIEESPSFEGLEDIQELQDVSELHPDVDLIVSDIEAAHSTGTARTALSSTDHGESTELLAVSKDARDTMQQQTVSVAANAPGEINVPLEISLVKDAEDIKLNISINLKIRFEKK